MAKKSKLNLNFSNIVNPDADPSEVADIGASRNFTRNPITPERTEELNDILMSPAQTSPTEKAILGKDADKVAELFPLSVEETIKRADIIPAPSEWNFFGKPSAESYSLTLQSIYRYGLWNPITVWEQADGSYMILGGHTRESCFDELYQITNDSKYLSIPCKVYKHDDLSEVNARRIIILSNIAQRANESAKLRIRCYCEMAKLEKESAFYGSGVDVNAAVAKLFGVSRRTVFRYRKIEKLIEEFIDVLSAGTISQRAAEIFSNLDEDAQKYIFAQNLYSDISSELLSRLKKIKTLEETKAAFSKPIRAKERYQYVYSMGFKKPENCDIVPICVDKKDVAEIQNKLKELILNDDKLSKRTKDVFTKMFS